METPLNRIFQFTAETDNTITTFIHQMSDEEIKTLPGELLAALLIYVTAERKFMECLLAVREVKAK